MPPTSARELIAAVLDEGSWISWDVEITALPADPAYADDVRRARLSTGLDEAVITGEGRIDGRRVALAGTEFGFLGGSIGVDAADRLVAAVERATAERLPLLASPTSGGTRMQEGTPAFVRMIAIADAVAAHRRAGLPYLVHLRHPTTGGVLASWGSLGHVTSAEPGATVGFVGPRVVEALTGSRLPPDVQSAEHLHDHGLLDAVVPTGALATVAARILRVLDGADAAADGPAPPVVDGDVLLGTDLAAADGAWDSVRRTRRPERPGVADWLASGFTDVTVLSGTGEGEYEPSLLLALARLGGRSVVVLGQDRRRAAATAPLGPAGLRTARRGMRLAEELGLALVTVIDTSGAALTAAAEEGGLAQEIARSLAEQVSLATPTLAVLLGQGAGGAALALLPADRVVAAAHAWLAPLPPEGASAVVHRSADHAAGMAAAQGICAADLTAAGIVDVVVAERPDAADEPEAFLARLTRVVAAELAEVVALDPAARAPQRRARYRGAPHRGVGATS